MIDLSPDQLETVLAVLAKHVPDCEVRAFGSRVKWTAKSYSDLDLAVVGPAKLAPGRLDDLREAFVESELPIRVDVLDWHAISDAFRGVIAAQFEVIQAPKESKQTQMVQGIAGEESTIGGLLDETGGSIKTGPFGTKLKASEYTATGVPVISVGEVGLGRLRIHDDTPRVDETVWSRMPEFLLKAGDIVFGRKGAVERSAQVQPDEDGYFLGSDGIRIRLNIEKCDPKFIAYQLQTTTHRSWMIQHAAGTTMPSLNEGIIRRIPIVLKPLSEQRAIAAVLGVLDDKIELNRRMNATLEEMARALFQSWFVDFDPVRAKLDGRPSTGLDKGTAALFPSTFQDSPLGPIPHGWEVGTIEDATSLIIDYRGRTPKKMGSDWSESGIPAVSAKNVKAGRLVRPEMFNFVSEELYERWMKDKLAIGDILMTSEAPLGELYYLALNARFCLSQRVFALRAKPGCCESAFLYYWIESPSCQTEVINRGTGTTVEGIRQSELRKVAVLLPPLPVQEKAARFLASWTEGIHRNEEQSRTLATLRDTLLPKLLSGELSVGNGQQIAGG